MKTPAFMFVTLLTIVSLASAIPNPASQFCIDCGYRCEIRTDPQGGQFGVCVFPDGSECEEWSFYRKCNSPQSCNGDCNCPWPCPKHIIYVDDGANGLNDGTSWQNAYNYLQDALADANSSAKPVEIRVAQGIYKPDQGSGKTPGDREATFQLINGVTIKGGYAGFGQPDPNARDTALYQTILYGNIGRLLDKSDNSYHIFYHPKGLNLDETAILDGFTITGGNANGSSWHNCGGGMLNYESSPTVTNCTFSGNAAIDLGGGMFNYNHSSPNVRDCTFSANSASSYGGGMGNYIYSNPKVNNCTFSENSAHAGGGMYNQDSSPMIDGCTFSGNSSIYGGGMYNYDNGIPRVEGCTFAGNSADIGGGMCNNHYSSPVVEGCTFSGNSATYDGGGMYNYDNCSPTVKGCTFSSNSAKLFGGGIRNYYSSPMVEACTFNANSTTYGGGMYNHYSSPTVEGCTFSRNWVTSGGGMYNFNSNSTVKSCTFSRNSATWGGGMWNDNSSPNVTNCILWADVQSEILGGIPIVTCSDVQGGWPGEGNINVDPCFADPNNGDYYLKSQAGHWDANSASWIKDDVTSPCIDAGDMSSPIGLEPFPNGGIINMGAYGGTAEASKSYFGEPVCETIVAGDINGDCVVNLADFAFMAYHWLEER